MPLQKEDILRLFKDWLKNKSYEELCESAIMLYEKFATSKKYKRYCRHFKHNTSQTEFSPFINAVEEARVNAPLPF